MELRGSRSPLIPEEVSREAKNIIEAHGVFEGEIAEREWERRKKAIKMLITRKLYMRPLIPVGSDQKVGQSLYDNFSKWRDEFIAAIPNLRGSEYDEDFKKFAPGYLRNLSLGTVAGFSDWQSNNAQRDFKTHRSAGSTTEVMYWERIAAVTNAARQIELDLTGR